jgi:two-component sensor histidine kinase
VVIDILQQDHRFVLVWTEKGGPPASKTDAEDGFGALLIRGAVKQQLSGDIEQVWLPDGLSVRVLIPSDHFSAKGYSDKSRCAGSQTVAGMLGW